ncbi:C39 family peptidase [Phyllobacterium endophyticum]|uniref:C39 family peptidase n=1 Tax=Phyllobacterium endophyticum TaxID=1149773 RepID=UPI0011CAD553|nr:C39 family peptidase [Phyllobacterium endophyticum]TXR50385.1 hypothetical protein FVA77_03490 [Phyllobacterium endophyticum]
MERQPEDVPFFSQWETPNMTQQVLAEGSAALLGDPLWRNSGAETIDEYARWAVNICGMACLKMVLATRGEIHLTLSLARSCAEYGGYVVNEDDASIKGLIYNPFVTFVRERFGLEAEPSTNLATADIANILQEKQFFIASVSSSIRSPERNPKYKGGHLVLVIAASPNSICFHNPAGLDDLSRSNVALGFDSRIVIATPQNQEPPPMRLFAAAIALQSDAEMTRRPCSV